MRTTVRLDDTLFREVKILGARTGRSFTALMAEALRDLVRRYGPPPRLAKPFKLITSKGKPRPGINIDSNVAILDFLDDDAARSRR